MTNLTKSTYTEDEYGKELSKLYFELYQILYTRFDATQPKQDTMTIMKYCGWHLSDIKSVIPFFEKGLAVTDFLKYYDESMHGWNYFLNRLDAVLKGNNQ